MKLFEVPVSSLPKTSGRTIKLLESLNIHTYFDLLHHFPFRYEDYSTYVPIIELFNKEYVRTEAEPAMVSTGKVSIKGIIGRFDNIRTNRGFQLQKIWVADETGRVDVTWFNQPYLRSVLKPGMEISLSGYVKDYQNTLSFQCEEYELLPTALGICLHTGRLVPMYEQTRGLSSKTIREKIWYVLQTYGSAIDSILPDTVLKGSNLVSDVDAYMKVHFPHNPDELHTSRDRMAFNELFIVQLSSHLIKEEWKAEKVGQPLVKKSHMASINSWIKTLPFTLTHAQERAFEDVLSDLCKPNPMNRLIQGDVGSGKTVVAAAAAYLTHLNGCTTLFMAPTEILAQQHYVSLNKLFADIPEKVRPGIALVTGSSKPSASDLKQASIIIGTHALISQKIDFEKVGLVIVDEQHKFGVVQRAKLKEKGVHPHLLSMTATPIPRTVTLTLYGELDVSVIDELPQGRKLIKTYVVPSKKRQDAYAWIQKDILESGAQIFVICPLIEESETESMQAVKAATVEFDNLQKLFPQTRIGLLHGRQKKAEKDSLLERFAQRELDILVSTPVVEVGIDIPGATIIMIETAERFGLAQLHQLRGRVGRSDRQSHCLLFTEHTDPLVLKRLHMFSKTHDGFKLAEFDLKRRGAGNMYGTQQHGISELRIASLSYAHMIEQTQKAVERFMKEKHTVGEFPELARRLKKYNTDHIARD